MLAKISYIKAAMYIIQACRKSITYRNLIKSMIYYCNLSSIPCIAEGVDSIEVYNELYDMGVDCFQGYLLSKTVHLEGMIALYQQNHFDINNRWPPPRRLKPLRQVSYYQHLNLEAFHFDFIIYSTQPDPHLPYHNIL